MIQNSDIAPVSFENVGVRNSRKRLKELIDEAAVEPLKDYQDELMGDFSRIEKLVMTRIAKVIVYWAAHKHEPLVPRLHDRMSDITNARRSDATLTNFYKNEVETAMHILATPLGISVPASYIVGTDELEFALLELEETFEYIQEQAVHDDIQEAETADENGFVDWQSISEAELDGLAATLADDAPPREHNIVPKQQEEIVETEPEQVEIETNILSMTAEEAWHTVYNLMGYESDYIQQKMLPRWKEHTDLFQNDRRFIYRSFIQSIRNATGLQNIGGHFLFADRRMTVDQLWNYYFTDLSQNVGPLLTAAALEAEVNAPWHKRAWKWLRTNMKNFSPIWLLALLIALAFDALTTYVSLNQTPMNGPIVLVFTVLITALFQIADVLVINYRKREFEADAMIAKYQAKVNQLMQMLEGLEPTSNSFVQLSMERSQAHADWKAAEDNRKMARRGRYWSARIADINIVVTAYGFAYMFLDANEPMYALFQQVEIIFVRQAWESVNLWVFLMVGLAITVSFVINTAQRTEILGWSMRRLKNEA